MNTDKHCFFCSSILPISGFCKNCQALHWYGETKLYNIKMTRRLASNDFMVVISFDEEKPRTVVFLINDTYNSQYLSSYNGSKYQMIVSTNSIPINPTNIMEKLKLYMVFS